MTTRGRKAELTYRKTQKKEGRNKPDAACTFCQINRGHEEFVEEGKYFKVLITLFRYSYWDEQEVEDHMMLVPKMHTESISKLPVAAATEFLEFVGKYEAKGYTIHARAPKSATKSVPHQHTHLIKTKGKRKKFVLYSRKPFLLIMR